MKVIETKNAPAAIGPYSQGMIAGNLVDDPPKVHRGFFLTKS